MSMKRPFQIGDRVRVYQFEFVGSQSRTNYVAEVVRSDYDDGSIRVQFGGTSRNVHPKQCRRLVMRERRRCWVHENSLKIPPLQNDGWIVSRELPVNDGPGPWIEFIEVRKPKVKP